MKFTWLVPALLLALAATAMPAAETDSDRYQQARLNLVRDTIEARGISDERVLRAMRTVPRHAFVPAKNRSRAYSDHPLPIGEGQTISQPYIVALMTEALQLAADARVLEIGTGSGYQAAVLDKVAGKVYSIEIRPALHQHAANTLRDLGYGGVETRQGDGYFGWAQAAPFDAIMITAAVDHIPPPLIAQLKEGGRLILPLGNPFSYQNLVLVTKQGQDVIVRQITGVLFVPMTGQALGDKPPGPVDSPKQAP